MFDNSKKLVDKKYKKTIINQKSIIINLFNSIVYIFLFDILLSNTIMALLIGFIFFIIFFLFDYLYFNDKMNQYILSKKLNIFFYNILVYSTNESKDYALRLAFKKSFDIDFDEDNYNMIKDNIINYLQNDYNTIFINAFYKTNNNNLLYKIINQINVFNENKEKEYNLYLCFKAMFLITYSIFLFLIYQIVNYDHYYIYIATLLITLFIEIIFLFAVFDKANNEENRLYNFYSLFYLYSMFNKPFIAYDLTLNHLRKKDKFEQLKNIILTNDFDKLEKLYFKKNTGKLYLLLSENLRKNLPVKEIINLNEFSNKDYSTLYKLVTYMIIFIPIITFIIEEFYL